MRIGRALVVHAVEVRGRCGIEDALRLRLLDRLVDGGLEAGQVHDRVGVDDGGDVTRRELEVVRLLPAGGQALDLHVGSADRRRHPLERIEAGDHSQPPVAPAVASRSARGAPGDDDHGEEDRDGPTEHPRMLTRNENESQT